VSVDFDAVPEVPEVPLRPEVAPTAQGPEVSGDLKSRFKRMAPSFANPLFGNPATSGVTATANQHRPRNRKLMIHIWAVAASFR